MDNRTAEVTWYMIKYVPDLVRREPINIGVVALTARGDWGAKFLRRRPDHTVAARLPHGIARSNYLRWIAYYERKAAAGTWEDVFRSQEHRPLDFNVEVGGITIADSGVQSLVDSLYRRVVTDDEEGDVNGARRLRVKTAVRHIFDRVGIEPHPDIVERGLYAEGASEAEIPFDYSFTNGRIHLMDALTSRTDVAVRVRDFNARTQAVMRREQRQASELRRQMNFVLFYSSEGIGSNDHDSVLRPAEEVGQAVDVDDADGAAILIGDMVTAHSG